MPQVKLGNLNFYYEQQGSGDPPFLFLPGWCCDHSFFQPQVDYFRSSHSVTTMDLRGCGRSDRPELGYDIPILTDDVATLCRELGLSKLVVVGHSLGGMMAVELAARYPDIAAAIVAVDPGPIDPLPATRTRFADFLTQLESPESEAVRRAYVRSLFLETDDANLKARVVDTMCSVPRHVAVEVIRHLCAWDGVGALKKCRAPLLIVLSGPGGSNIPERLLPHKPDIQYAMTVGAGHFHQLEVPEQVTPMIARFVRIAFGPARAAPTQ